jgi:hypothetical protein
MKWQNPQGTVVAPAHNDNECCGLVHIRRFTNYDIRRHATCWISNLGWGNPTQEVHRRTRTDLTLPWIGAIGLAIAVGIAYFFAAQLSLALLAKPDGVAVFWPAAGVSSGVLIALRRDARLPVASGVMVATIVANLTCDRNVWSAAAFAFCNAGEALLTPG